MEPACAAALEHELKHIQNVFSELNDYPPFKLVETTIKDEKNNFQQNESVLEMDEEEKKRWKSGVKNEEIYLQQREASKLGSRFNIKDKIAFESLSDII